MTAGQQDLRDSVLDPSSPVADTRSFERADDLVREVISTEDRMMAIRPEWTRLSEASDAMIQSGPDWSIQWWKVFGRVPNRTLRMLAWWADQKLVALAPFYVGETVIADRVLQRRLRLIGSGGAVDELFGYSDDYGISDFLDIPILPDRVHQIASDLVRWVRMNPLRIDMVQLLHVRSDRPSMRALIHAFNQSELSMSRQMSDRCPWLDLTRYRNVEDFINSRPSKSTRRRLKQSLAASNSGGPLRIETIHDSSALEDAFRDLVQLHQNRWRRLGYHGIFDDERFERFIIPVLERLLEEQALLGYVARPADGGAPLGVRLGLLHHGVVYDFLTGFDDMHELSRHRPGLSMLMKMIEEAIGNGYRTLEFLRGLEGYKFDFTDHAVANMHIRIDTDLGQRRRHRHRVVNGVSNLHRVTRREMKLLSANLSGHAVNGLKTYTEMRVQSLRHHLSDPPMLNTGHELPPALTLSEIGLVHTLGEAGLPVIAGSFFHDNPALHSRHVRRKVHFSRYDTARFIDELVEVGRSLQEPAMLVSDDDRAILNISRHRNLLESHYRFRLPDSDLVDRVYDKSRFADVCREFGLPAPESAVVNHARDLEDAIARMPFPCIMKPPFKEYWWREDFEKLVGPYKKAYRLDTKDQLRSLYSKISALHPSVILQEYIPGGDAEHMSVNFYADDQSKVVALFSARKHRVYPITAGVGCYIEIFDDPALRNLCEEITETLGLTGLLNIQFKRHAATGEYRLIEIQFRNSFWSYIGTFAGINLPALYYADLNGYPRPSIPDRPSQVKFFDFNKDLKAYLAYRRAGQIGFREWLSSYQGHKTFHGFHADDPLPALMSLAYPLRRRLAPGRRTIESEQP